MSAARNAPLSEQIWNATAVGAAAGATSALAGGRGLSVTQLATDAFGNALAAGLISRTTYASEAPATVDQVAAQLDRGAIDGDTAYTRLAANTSAGDATYAQLVAEMSRAQGYGGQLLAVLADNSFSTTTSDAGNGGYDFERSYIDAGGVMQVEASTTPFGAEVTVDNIDMRTGAITWDSGAVSYPVSQAQTSSLPLDGVIGAASSLATGIKLAGAATLGVGDAISGAVQSAGYSYGIVGTAESRAAWAMNVAPAAVESIKNFIADPIMPVQQWWGDLVGGQESAVRSASAGLTGLLIGSTGAIGVKGGSNLTGISGKLAPNRVGAADAAASSGTSTVFRVQGGEMPKASKTLITLDANGSPVIKNGTLNISIGDASHAKYFQALRPGSTVTSFDIPSWLDNFIHESAISQDFYRINPLNQGGLAPKIVDLTTPGRSYELPPPWGQWLQENAVPGSGKVHQ